MIDEKDKQKKPAKTPKIKIVTPQRTLYATFVLGVGAILLFAVSVFLILQFVFIYTGVIPQTAIEDSGALIIIGFGFASLVSGMFLAWVFSKIILNPISDLVKGMHKLSKGEYTTRLDYGKNSYMQSVATTFNTLAQELENTEILRSDFVNNFSHEFKTPIVSISGLVSMLKQDNVSLEKRREYINVIEEEALRLSHMTTNVLHLSKIENQVILTDVTEFNLSEQIRNCVLLAEKRWTSKNLSLALDFDEYNVVANEELLKHVWINLIENAIKFANPNTELKITIDTTDKNVVVKVTDEGRQLKEEEQDKIFAKFYQSQGEKIQGNGIGLAIVKHVVSLHAGTVKAYSENGLTTFEVSIPRKTYQKLNKK